MVHACEAHPEDAKRAGMKLASMATSHEYQKPAVPNIFLPGQVPKEYDNEDINSLLDRIKKLLLKSTTVDGAVISQIRDVVNQLRTVVS
jgi:hypothetical protein